MISFNEHDINMSAIAARAKLFNTVTRYGYRIYGLKLDRTKLIRIQAPPNLLKDELPRLGLLADVFEQNNLAFGTEENSKLANETFHIGLRLDLREYPEFTARCLKTIIYGLEDLLILQRNFRFSHVPTALHKPELW